MLRSACVHSFPHVWYNQWTVFSATLECTNEYFLSVLLKVVTYFSTYSVSKTPSVGSPMVLHLEIEGSQCMRSYVITTEVCASLAMLNLHYVLYVAFAHFHMMICSDGKGLSLTFLEKVTKFDGYYPHYHHLTPNVSQNVCYSSCFLWHWYFSSWVSVDLSGTG